MTTAELAKQIPEWIKKKVDESGCNGVVLGMSGGIDSAVVAALCKKALGDKVLGVIMPCKSLPKDREDAELTARKLDLELQTVPLDEILNSFLKVLPESPGFVQSNMKPRLRMTALYYIANLHSYLVVGTGNRSEVMVGYYTKYGDGGVDLLPIAGLHKTEVLALATELGIPAEIIEKAPSAGLWEGQTDEDELGITYAELDQALTAIDAGTEDRFDAKTINKVKEMIAKSAHKRALPEMFKIER